MSPMFNAHVLNTVLQVRRNAVKSNYVLNAVSRFFSGISVSKQCAMFAKLLRGFIC